MVLKKLTNRERNICILLFVLGVFLRTLNVPGMFFLVSVFFLSVFFMYMGDFRFRKIAFSAPLLIWLVLTLYHWCNAMLKHVPEVNIVDLFEGLKIYSCIVIFAYWASIDLKKTVHFLIITFLIRCFIVISFPVVFPQFAETSTDRLTGIGGSATGIAGVAAIVGIYVAYENVFRKNSLSRNIALLLLPITVILLTQGRNAIAMMSISVLTIMVLMRQYNKKFSYFRILPALVFFIVLAYGGIQIISDTSLGERFQTDYTETRYYSLNATGTIFDRIVGDRLVYYVRGWEFFQESPITGIGMWNYRFLTGGKYPLHTEYMVHLCEGGLIAAILWLSFLFSVVYLILKYGYNKQYRLAALSSVGVLLFSAIYAREFFGEIYYPVYGLALSFYFNNKYFQTKRSYVESRFSDRQSDDSSASN